jgi:putative intracellular protease/amidase
MTQHILFIVTSHDRIDADRATGLWFEEFAHPYEVFQKQGYRITVASPKGGKTPIDPSSTPAPDAVSQYAEAIRALENTLPLTSVNAADYDAVFMPGGHGTMFDLPTAQVGKIVGAFADADKIVAAVCHGPAGLVAAQRLNGQPVVAGHRVTGFTNDEEDAAQLSKVMPFLLQNKLAELGATFIPSPMWNDHVVVDGKLITGQNPQSGRSTADAVVTALNKIAV